MESSDIQNLPIYANDKEIKYDESKGLSAEIPANNHLVNILSIWARFFDQLKMYIDSLVEITNLDYENMNNNFINGIILPIACKKLGFDFKEMLTSPNKSKLEGNKLTYEDVISSSSLRQIQNSIWKRILINSQDYIMSKGTKSSIKSILNSFGIKHDNFFTLREYSDTNIIDFTKSGKRKNQHYMFFNFLELNNTLPTYNSGSNNFSDNLPYINIKNIVSNYNNNKGFSDNWTLEMFINFDKINTAFFKNKQNILRIDEKISSVNSPILSLYFEKSSSESSYYKLNMEFAIKVNDVIEKKTITIDNINLFEGIKYITLNQKEILYNNATKELQKQSNPTDKWYEFEVTIKDGGYINSGRKSISKKLSVKFKNDQVNQNFLLSNTNDIDINIGEFSYTSSTDRLTTHSNGSQIIDTAFQGKVNCIRLWSKYISDKERYHHSIDLKNIGEDVFNPGNSIEFNFQFRKEIDVSSIANNIYNINSFYNKKSIVCDVKIPGTINEENLKKYNKVVHSTILSNTLKIDEPDIENKVSILSYSDEYFKKEENNFYKFPIHEIPEGFNFQNDKRFSVELSNVKFINNDIAKLIASTNHFSNSIINSTSMFSYEYNVIKEHRSNYFKRLDKEIDNKILLNFFKYFDNSLQSIIRDSIPTNVGNIGFNFIYESHALERHKYEYKMSDNRVSIVDKLSINDYSKVVEPTYRNIFKVIE